MAGCIGVCLGLTARWSIRAKPYIYRVLSDTDASVFIGTDGNGGRLLGFDAATGREVLNLRPAVGGVGDVAHVANHAALVATFRTSKSYSVAPRLLVVSLTDLKHRLDVPCHGVVGVWDQGAVCRAGRRGERLGIVDLR